MLELYQIDLLARGGSIALLALWSWVLFRDHRSVLSARAALAMNITIICYILSGLFLSQTSTNIFGIITDTLSVYAPAFFWLFALTWFNDLERIGNRNWLLLGLFAVLPLAQTIIKSVTGDYSLTCWIMVRIGMFAFGVAGLWIAYRGRDNDLVEGRRRFRFSLVWAIGGFVIWVNMVELLAHSQWSLPQSRTFTEIAMFVVTFIASVALYNLTQPDLFAAARKHKDSATTPVLSSSAEQLQAYMTHERIYREEGLTIAALAAKLGEQEYKMRRLINGELGFRNFTAFLNSYRLAEVREALTDPSQKEVPIITIALDAGFGSLGPFNRAFREAEGMTPSEYRNHVG
jgi:AraC-like DNA-binding protein